ncbi:putative multiple-sugar transport system permease YteP [Spirochaetia bacterium]|nr:putative multiple-sugar transport system permease YteP [Spirochaetia bacterium]
MNKSLKKAWYFRASYLMVLPGLAWFIIFRYVPMYGAVIAFKDFNLKQGILKSPWAEPLLKHFFSFFNSNYFSQLIGNTLVLSLAKLALGMSFAIILALLLNECANKLVMRFVQTLTYIPHFLSWIIVYGIVLVFLSETDGLINQAWGAMGFKAIPFLSSPVYFRQVLVFTDIWKECGWSAIIYLAAMTGIDPCLYEAARIDGASRLQMIWNITIPSISSVIVVLLILRLGSVLDAGFDQVYIFYNPLVYSVSDIIDTWVYRTGLEQLNFSLGAAVGLFKSVIGILLIGASNLIAKRLGGQGLW